MKLFGQGQVERIQAELDKAGAQGWELVAVDTLRSTSATILYLKREH